MSKWLKTLAEAIASMFPWSTTAKPNGQKEAAAQWGDSAFNRFLAEIRDLPNQRKTQYARYVRIVSGDVLHGMLHQYGLANPNAAEHLDSEQRDDLSNSLRRELDNLARDLKMNDNVDRLNNLIVEEIAA